MIKEIPVRTFRVCELILAGCNSQTAAERLGISRKTVARDVDALRDLGVPVQYDYRANRWQVGRPAIVPRWFVTLTRVFEPRKEQGKL